MKIRSLVWAFALGIAATSCNDESSKASNSPTEPASFSVPSIKKDSLSLDTIPIKNVTINGISIDQITPVGLKKA